MKKLVEWPDTVSVLTLECNFLSFYFNGIKMIEIKYKQKPIILLDLNYTLVGNSAKIRYLKPYQNKIKNEEYRKWLIDLIDDYHVILITARPDYQEKCTVQSIKKKLNGWMPEEMYFQEENDTPPIAKEKLLKKYIFPKHGMIRSYLAIESNPKTKLMYKNYNIPSISVYEEDGIEIRNILNKIESNLTI